jgi:hypothetical protein
MRRVFFSKSGDLVVREVFKTEEDTREPRGFRSAVRLYGGRGAFNTEVTKERTQRARKRKLQAPSVVRDPDDKKKNRQRGDEVDCRDGKYSIDVGIGTLH